MRKFFFFALVATMFAACTTDATQDVAVGIETPETLIVSFEEESRIQLQNGKTVWTAGDLLSVFYRSNANQKWQYQGDTGERSGSIARVANAEATQELSNIVVVYPYNENYYINPRTYNVQASLPATQTYKADSYGIDGNIMISSSEYKHFALKSVCGWLKVQLTGNGETIKSITLKGNNGEQVAGEIYINSADASCELALNSSILGDDSEVGGSIFEDGTILKTVTLDCGDGVMLGAEPTAFYVALPPQTFEKGLTIDITDITDFVMTKSTGNKIIVERNTIQPMSAFEFVNPNTPTTPTPANNEIWYTATEKVEPYFSDAITFGANVIGNTFDTKTGKGIITFDKDVTMIGESAFSACDVLMSIILPNNVISIGNYAFQDCKNLMSVTIGEGVETLGTRPFKGCVKLSCFEGKFAKDNGRLLVVDGKLVAFAPAGITEYIIPSSVTNINSYVFSDCSDLTNITIGDGVRVIGGYAFSSCTKLRSVEFGENVQSIGGSAFRDCSQLGDIVIPDNVTYIGDSAFAWCRNITSVTIGKNVTELGYHVFYYCTSLKAVYCTAMVPPAYVTSVSETPFEQNAAGRRIYVYAECLDLYKTAWSRYSSSIYSYGNYPEDNPTTTITYTTSDEQIVNSSILPVKDNKYTNGVGEMVIYGDLKYIPNEAFRDCNTLTSIIIPNGMTTIGQNAFLNCTSLTDVSIPNSVKTISWGAFGNCKSLTGIDIPSSVQTIGAYAFEDCSSLLSFIVPEGVKSISCTFRNCYNLKSVYIPNSVTEIGMYTFYRCYNLTSVTIPASVNRIGYQAFYGCSRLIDIYCMPTIVPTCGWVNYTWVAFNGIPSDSKIYVPRNSVDAYKSAEYWSDYADRIVGYDF